MFQQCNVWTSQVVELHQLVIHHLYKVGLVLLYLSQHSDHGVVLVEHDCLLHCTLRACSRISITAAFDVENEQASLH